MAKKNVNLAGAIRGTSHTSGDLTVVSIVMSPNRVVAYNLHRARNLRGWTQEQAAERLELFIGKRWSKASWSAAERSSSGGERLREFTADELIAFSRCFELPPAWFLAPPPETVEIELPGGSAASQRREAYVAMLAGDDAANARKLAELERDMRSMSERLRTVTVGVTITPAVETDTAGTITPKTGKS